MKTLHEWICRDLIEIDFNEGILYGHDQVFDTLPCVFATVEFYLCATDGLCRIADAIRKEAGKAPSEERSYNFYIGINAYTASKVDSSITFTVYDEFAEDNGEAYDIDLSDEDQAILYRIINDQCIRNLHTEAQELLKEAAENIG